MRSSCTCRRRNASAAFAFILAAAVSLPTDSNAQRPVSAPDTLQLTLADARLRGLRDNADLIAIRLDTAIARGALRQAGTLLFNPAFDVVAPVAGNNSEFVMSQELEIFGQRGKRVAAGQASIKRARADTDNAARLIVGEIDRTFYQLVSASERTRLAEEILALNSRLASVAERQLAAGEISRLDYNLAVVELGRSRSRMLSTRREREQVEYELERLLGLRGNVHLVPNIGSMQDEGIPDSTATVRAAHDHAARAARLNSDSLFAVALTQRQDLTERSAATEQAAAEAALTRREALPNLLLRGVLQRGPNGNQSIAPGVGISLPIFNRSRGLAQARDAVAKQSELVFASLLVRVRTEVASEVAAYRSAAEEVEILETTVLVPARQNRQLLEAAYREGKVGLPVLLLIRNQVIDAELEYWAAWLAERIALANIAEATAENMPPRRRTP